jgi:hypothetical protein
MTNVLVSIRIGSEKYSFPNGKGCYAAFRSGYLWGTCDDVYTRLSALGSKTGANEADVSRLRGMALIDY